MTNQIQPSSETTEKQQPLHLTLVVNGQPYQAEVNPQEIYHEALEHALPAGLLVGHRIIISTADGGEGFPDMVIGGSVADFKKHTFHIEARPLIKAAAQSRQEKSVNF